MMTSRRTVDPVDHGMRRLLPALVIVGQTLACASAPVPAPAPAPKPAEVREVLDERAGLVLEHDAYGDSATTLVYLDQNWNPPQTLWYYHADQGSVLMPYDTLVNLEQAGSRELIIAPEFLTRFRWLNQRATPNNRDALPVGFSRHDDEVGLTCAACHTGQINYQGTAMRIDGAPSLIDVNGFFVAIEQALAQTISDDAKLGRFAAGLSKRRPGGEVTAAQAKEQLQASLAWFQSYNRANHSTTAEGFGRLDAIGRIFNQLIRFTSSPDNSLEPNAPTSFPVLWDAPRLDYVQWTGFSGNAGAGALGRNAGEVIGVFGRVDVVHYEDEVAAKKGYRSTIEANELVAMEEALRKLSSPQWPEEILPPIDRALAKTGEALYETHCISCHHAIVRDDPTRSPIAPIYGLEVVGTDATEIDNMVNARAPSGTLEGALHFDEGKPPYEAEEPVFVLLGDLVTRSLSARAGAAVKAMANSKLHGLEETEKQGDYTADTPDDPLASLRAYKARPLNGVWASSPYLHNGSVPTLYDLLLPPDQRPKTFAVGRFEYDPKKVGYAAGGEGPFVVDTSIVGNGNAGHEYGTMLGDDERWALVEYLKTL